MHGAWGGLSTLLKKQEAARNRKAALKYELQKRRESLLKDNAVQEMEFPEISAEEMKVLKAAIRKRYKADRIKNNIKNILLFVFVILLFYFIFRYKK